MMTIDKQAEGFRPGLLSAYRVENSLAVDAGRKVSQERSLLKKFRREFRQNQPELDGFGSTSEFLNGIGQKQQTSTGLE
jgi:hypothetical protein